MIACAAGFCEDGVVPKGRSSSEAAVPLRGARRSRSPAARGRSSSSCNSRSLSPARRGSNRNSSRSLSPVARGGNSNNSRSLSPVKRSSSDSSSRSRSPTAHRSSRDRDRDRGRRHKRRHQSSRDDYSERGSGGGSEERRTEQHDRQDNSRAARGSTVDADSLRGSDHSHSAQHGERRSGSPHSSSSCSRPWQQQQEQEQPAEFGQGGQSAGRGGISDAGWSRSVRQSVSERFPEALSDIGVNPTPWVPTGLGPLPNTQSDSSPTDSPVRNGAHGGQVSAMSASDDAALDSSRQQQNTTSFQDRQGLATSAVNNVMCGSIQPSHAQHPESGGRDAMTNGVFRMAASIGQGSLKEEASSIGQGPPLRFQLPSQSKPTTFRRPFKGVSQLRPLGEPDSPRVSSGSE